MECGRHPHHYSWHSACSKPCILQACTLCWTRQLPSVPQNPMHFAHKGTKSFFKCQKSTNLGNTFPLDPRDHMRVNVFETCYKTFFSKRSRELSQKKSCETPSKANHIIYIYIWSSYDGFKNINLNSQRNHKFHTIMIDWWRVTSLI